MASSELDWTASQSYELDSTDGTIADEDEKDSTDGTIADGDDKDSTDGTIADGDDKDSTDGTIADEKMGLHPDSTEAPQNNFNASIEVGQGVRKIPASEIHVRTIAVEPSIPTAVLPAEPDAAFNQWLRESGLAPSKH